LDKVNSCLAGRVLDFTHKHGCDRRIWSPSLCLWRDVYVYIPPNYDPGKSYPLLLWLHGFGGDEWQFIRQVVRELDKSIVSGAMPPVIAVAPDGSVPSTWKPWYQGSWYINGRQGRWEDYMMNDVLRFVEQNFRIRPEREAHVIAGWSMGGFGAYNLGMKHSDYFRVLVGIYPNLNLRYVDRQGHWGTDFDPENTTWLEDMKGRWLVGAYPKYRFPINAGVVFLPAWGRRQDCIARMSQENPIELLDRLDVQDGRFDMFVSYGKRDEYNVDAQVESFLYRARERGLNVWVRCNPEGHHSTDYVNECMPEVLAALGRRLRELLPDVDSPPAASSAATQPPSVEAVSASLLTAEDTARPRHPAVLLGAPVPFDTH
jgi:S-formylglutathione hydrolase FrmB